MICFSCKQASPATFIITHFLQGGETTMHRIKKNISKIPELIMNRVYIHLDDSYNIISDSNLTPLINAVAKQHPIAYGVTLSESNSDCTIFYPKRTLHFILHEIDDFIYGINQRKADETMATFTSLKQIRRVNYLNQHLVCHAGSYHVLGDVTGCISCRTVHLTRRPWECSKASMA